MVKISYKIADDDDNIVNKGKIRIFCPNFRDFYSVMLYATSYLSPEERTYIYKMIYFHTLFPPNDVVAREYVDYTNMLNMGVFSKKYSIEVNKTNLNELFNRTVYNNKKFKLPMSKESYHSFKLMVLDEIIDIEKDIISYLDTYINQKIMGFSIIKKIKVKLQYNKINNAKKEALKQIYEFLNKECKESEKEIVSERFYEDASNLLDKFNQVEYDLLIKRLASFLYQEYEKYHSDYLLEEIEYINSAQSDEERHDILCWIYENTSARSDAFDLMKVDAENIFLHYLYLYFRNYYIKKRKKMNREERRFYQLCFFRRDALLGKIPVMDAFLKSFWESNMELIISGIVVNRNNPLYYEKNKELESKWKEFLEIYPIALQSAPIINKLNDKQKCIELAMKNFKDKEFLIVKAYIENHEIQTICASYDISIKECEYLIREFRKVVLESEKDISI